jgi:hypothetical protein
MMNQSEAASSMKIVLNRKTRGKGKHQVMQVTQVVILMIVIMTCGISIINRDITARTTG